jgi:transcriptional regulator with XRE-family HTH domain
MKAFNISDNLKQLIRLHGNLTLSDLARKTKVPQPTLHHILEGKTKKPRKQAIEAIANFFKISSLELTGVIPFSLANQEALAKTLKISTIPLIGWHHVKEWINDKQRTSCFEQIIFEKKVVEKAFALTMPDNSMEPIFQKNSILIFDPSKEFKNRDFILVFFPELNSIKFNRLFIDNYNFYLKQDKDNGDIELIKINSTSNILATLIEARIDFNS